MARFISIIALLALVGCDAAVETAPRGLAYYLANPSLLKLVEVLSGKSNDERREIVSRALSVAGIPYVRQPFRDGGLSGENLVVEVGSGPKALVIATHFDRVLDSPGANDNASCVAAAIIGLEVLHTHPPDHIKVAFLFSDLEEVALAGSRYYVANTDLSGLYGVISFDLCGIGDAVGIWDIRDDMAESLVVRALIDASRQDGAYYSTHGPVARFSSDHQSFFEKGVVGVGVTVVPREDEARLRAYVDNPNSTRWLIRSFRPRVFRTYHTSNDTPLTLDVAALELAQRIIVGTVRALDALVAPAS
jgi:hypothetical protein